MPKIPAQTCGISPEQCVVIEDSPTGVAAARAAAMAVIYLNAAGERLDGAETARHPDEVNL